MPANKSKNKNAIGSPVVKTVIFGLCFSVLFFIIIALFAFFALKNGLSSSIYMPAGFVFGAVSGFINGFVVAKLVKEKGALYGFVSGIVQSFVCAVSLFIVNGGIAGKSLLIISALMIVLSAVGGMAGINLKIKKKY